VRAALCVLAVCAAVFAAARHVPDARAQDSQQDWADRIVGEQEIVRRNAVDRAMSAPALAEERLFGPAGAAGQENPDAAPASRPSSRSRGAAAGVPWGWILALGGVGVAALFVRSIRRAGRID
jgi:hypothetical protein